MLLTESDGWRVITQHGDFRIVEGAHARGVPSFVITSAMLATAIDGEWNSERIWLRLYELLMRERIMAPPRGFAVRIARPRVCDAIDRGRWVAVAVTNRHAVVPATVRSDEPTDSIPATFERVKTFVEFELLDVRGRAMAGAKYRVVLPDGSTREGALDDEGRARIDGIDPGTCHLEFLELTHDEASPP